ncbi:cation:proton antiporter [Hippea maritima]|uniref:Sodium/hydrogen exchanger n=1 Tax=Hippea maritima (strain ATCC 700847 / DSM 10411 / MH2) TaxID=760142 RepID=F2LTL7_HIPMA|nr:cation:proton antiporter [Hippea maritima]AEA33342.1 sodium/hydrogen exchanger [Hippea maritima DSM 10411]
MIDSLTLIVILSFLIPILTTRITKELVPSVAFEIFVGFIIGKSGLNLIHTGSETMEFLSNFGLAFLMFLGGLETQINTKKHAGGLISSPYSLAGMIFILTAIMSWLFSSFLTKTFNCSKSILYMTLIFSTTSVAIVFPTLKSRNDLKNTYKQTLLYAAFFADFLTLIAITIFSAYEDKNRITAEILIFFLFIAVVFLFVKFIKKVPKNENLAKSIQMVQYKPHIQIGIRGSFAILFLFMFLSEKLGIEIILGSFIAGIIISTINQNRVKVLRAKLDAIGYGFFIPLFFIYQGAKSTIPLKSETGLHFIIITIVGAIAIKTIASLPLILRFSLKETLAGGVLLSGRLSLIIAASIIGTKLKIISKEINSAIIILAAISCILSPFIFNLILRPKKQTLFKD